jgi:heme-degrading monooxygenase HmoA
MYARFARYEIPPDRVEDAIEAFREAATGLTALDGSMGGYLLVDRDDGKLVTFTRWENQAALEGSEVRAAALRRQAMSEVGGEVVAVRTYEIAFEFEA